MGSVVYEIGCGQMPTHTKWKNKIPVIGLSLAEIKFTVEMRKEENKIDSEIT